MGESVPKNVLVTREIPPAGLRALEPFDVRSYTSVRRSARSCLMPYAAYPAFSRPLRRTWTGS